MKLRIITYMAIATLLTSGSLMAEDEAGRDVLVLSFEGTVEYQRGGEGDWLPVDKEVILKESDIVRTQVDSRCSLLFKGMSNASIDVNPESVMELRTLKEERSGDDTELDLILGSVLVKAEELKGESSFKVRTPNSIVGIRGTVFEVNVD